MGVRQNYLQVSMKFYDDSEQAAKYLRDAIPAMVKYSIVPNPLNYTLWYSYFAQLFPELNKELEQTISKYGTCPPKVGESLFIRHIGQLDSDQEEQKRAFQSTFSRLVGNLSDAMDNNARQTRTYSDALKQNITQLQGQELGQGFEPVLRALNANANAICDANDSFQGQLSAAQSQIEELQQKLAKSQREANTDPLTGLYNRRVFEAIYHQFVEQQAGDEELALIILDIDKFKLFNDTHGHLLGDQVLKFVAKLLRQECPASVTPVRFGGEEFAIVCPHHSLDQANAVAEKIRTKLATVGITNRKTGAKIPPITASFGIACKRGLEKMHDVIERADKALYVAKEMGRNRVEIAI